VAGIFSGAQIGRNKFAGFIGSQQQRLPRLPRWLDAAAHNDCARRSFTVPDTASARTGLASTRQSTLPSMDRESEIGPGAKALSSGRGGLADGTMPFARLIHGPPKSGRQITAALTSSALRYCSVHPWASRRFQAPLTSSLSALPCNADPLISILHLQHFPSSIPLRATPIASATPPTRVVASVGILI